MQEAKTLAEQIINRGKEAFNNKCYLDALWKYANAYELCCVNGLSNNIKGKVLLYCAEASLELLKESPPHKHYHLGLYSVSCSTKCINSALPEFQVEVSINLLGHASFIRPTRFDVITCRPTTEEPKFGNTYSQSTECNVNLMTISAALRVLLTFCLGTFI